MDTGNPPDFPQKRETQRVSVALPVELDAGRGTTRDVSVSGVFFETGHSFLLGSPISFSLVLEHVDPIGPVRLHCQGSVVRVERRSGTVGVAVAINSHRFEPTKNRAQSSEHGLTSSSRSGRGAA